MTPGTVKNIYYLMRHGQSLANKAGIIISNPVNGCNAYGLTETGREQIRESLNNCDCLCSETLIYCSDFLRTVETADLASKILNTAAPCPSELLRERNFGEYEKSDDSNYRKVWEKDILDGNNKHLNVESPEEVRVRFLSFISEIEDQFAGKDILIVSHGDILQIALTWPEAAAPKDHRSQNHLKTAEIRLFNQKN
jgi:broad specificity phosphatase PhoE